VAALALLLVALGGCVSTGGKNVCPLKVIFEGPQGVLDFYPERAMRLEQQGSARISCLIDADGSLKDCKAVSENPRGWGFGEAAVGLAAVLRVEVTPCIASMPAGTRSFIPLRFTLEDAGGT